MPRPKGSRNKPRLAVLNAMKEEFGENWDPLIQMARQANAMAAQVEADPEPTVDSRASVVTAFERVTKYVHPALKAMEVDLSSNDGSMSPPRRVKLVAVYDDPEGRVAELEHQVDSIEDRLDGPISD